MADNVITEVVIDKENMKIDRNCDAGKAFDALQAQANAMEGTEQGRFMNQILAYAEASFVVAQTMPPKQAAETISQLRDKFATECGLGRKDKLAEEYGLGKKTTE